MERRRIRVWLNHWFSTAYHIINLIKEDDIDFYVIGTNENPDAVIQLVCDEWYQEPRIDDPRQYVDYCLDFCREHKIQVFVPRRKLPWICRYQELFEQIGVKVLAEKDWNLIFKLQDKGKTYEMFEKLGIASIPPYQVVKNREEFCRAYESLKKPDNQICLKFVSDEGGLSFHIIEDSADRKNAKPIQNFYGSSGRKMDYETVLERLGEDNLSNPLLLMPYLEGTEVSADCLRTKKGNIVIPRFKSCARAEEVRFEPEIIQICEAFLNRYGLTCPCNIQFRYSKDRFYLLEVNTRMSGGVQLSCLAAQVNIPNLAVNQLLGIEKDWEIRKENRKVTYIETPKLL